MSDRRRCEILLPLKFNDTHHLLRSPRRESIGVEVRIAYGCEPGLARGRRAGSLRPCCGWPQGRETYPPNWKLSENSLASRIGLK